ncbi:polysaccharide deacetylase family protein [Microlunatus flavus]|uniref:Chitooligosaccharide deacetylase n=1 Tax=Microlunatus flavus TaxID=1036181 RepID=A0A1H9CWI7_9ACTN|nr:polysaccharide deacetylase family protein [Microlunatus flavus]SEQ05580.1 chitooligosaccharide deacetylase [Microlunatus flavus]
MRGLIRRLDGRRQAWRWRLLDALAGSVRRTGPGTVALTFDDGPRPGSTDRVLDVLAELGVPATFFCVGRNAERHPELVRRAQAEGHAVGSHSHTHPDPQVTPLRVLAADYRRGHAAVEDALGGPVALFRPPRGWIDLPRAFQLRRAGTPPVLWSVDPQDWHPEAQRDLVAEVAGAAGERDVVLLHDWVEQPWDVRALDRSQTVTALAGVVAAVRARGLGFSTLAGRAG